MSVQDGALGPPLVRKVQQQGINSNVIVALDFSTVTVIAPKYQAAPWYFSPACFSLRVHSKINEAVTFVIIYFLFENKRLCVKQSVTLNPQ